MEGTEQEQNIEDVFCLLFNHSFILFCTVGETACVFQRYQLGHTCEAEGDTSFRNSPVWSLCAHTGWSWLPIKKGSNLLDLCCNELGLSLNVWTYLQSGCVKAFWKLSLRPILISDLGSIITPMVGPEFQTWLISWPSLAMYFRSGW